MVLDFSSFSLAFGTSFFLPSLGSGTLVGVMLRIYSQGESVLFTEVSVQPILTESWNGTRLDCLINLVGKSAITPMCCVFNKSIVLLNFV